MNDFIDTFKEWVTDLGNKHGVDPVLIFFLYLFSKVSLFTFLGFTINNIRLKKPFLTTLLMAGISFCIPYTYILIIGRNLPAWIYLVIAVLFILGAFSIWRKLSVKVR